MSLGFALFCAVDAVEILKIGESHSVDSVKKRKSLWHIQPGHKFAPNEPKNSVHKTGPKAIASHYEYKLWLKKIDWIRTKNSYLAIRFFCADYSF
jgi:hypothetical protein